MKKMKIAFIIQGFSFSGAEVVLNRFLNKNKHIEPYIFLIFYKKEVMNKFIDIYGQNKVFCLNLNKFKFINKIHPGILSSVFYSKFKLFINKIKPDIIYANNSTETIIVGYCKKINIPKVAHIHDMISSMKNRLRRYALKKSLNNFNKIITVSQACKDDLDSKKLDIKVIYNGLEEDYFVNNLKTNSNNNIFHIGFVGSFIPRKGIDILINSILKIKKNNIIPSMKCSIVYNNKKNNFFKKNHKLIVSNKDIFEIYKNIETSKVKQFYRSLDLLVVPSRFDPLPTVIMEAMANGTLVIGAKTSGIPEMLGDETLLFKKDSISSLKNKIIKIYSMDKDSKKRKKLYLYNRAKKLFNTDVKKNKANKILYKLLMN